MKRHPLGTTGLEVSEIGYGASPLGSVFGVFHESDGISAVHTALDLGVDFLDVSPYYGATTAETVLGKALRGVDRSSYVLATKVGRYGDAEFDFTGARVKRSVRESMARLGVDHLDLVQCHDIEFADLDQIVGETLPALRELQQAGTVRAVGITGYPLPALAYVLERADVDTVMSYCQYTLQDRRLAAWSERLTRRGAAVINAAPLAMGALTSPQRRHGTRLRPKSSDPAPPRRPCAKPGAPTSPGSHSSSPRRPVPSPARWSARPIPRTSDARSSGSPSHWTRNSCTRSSRSSHPCATSAGSTAAPRTRNREARHDRGARRHRARDRFARALLEPRRAGLPVARGHRATRPRLHARRLRRTLTRTPRRDLRRGGPDRRPGRGRSGLDPARGPHPAVDPRHRRARGSGEPGQCRRRRPGPRRGSARGRRAPQPPGRTRGFVTSPDLLAGVRLLGDHALPFDACVRARQLGELAGLADACPSTTIILDHLGKPAPGDPDIAEWRDAISILARRENVVCKLSGLATEAAPGTAPGCWPACCATAIDAFGPERCMYGSDWPVMTLATTYPPGRPSSARPWTAWPPTPPKPSCPEPATGSTAWRTRPHPPRHRTEGNHHAPARPDHPAQTRTARRIPRPAPRGLARRRGRTAQGQRAQLQHFPAGDTLFGYFEYHGEDFAADIAAIAADEDTRRWWTLTDPCQESWPDAGPAPAANGPT